MYFNLWPPLLVLWKLVSLVAECATWAPQPLLGSSLVIPVPCQMEIRFVQPGRALPPGAPIPIMCMWGWFHSSASPDCWDCQQFPGRRELDCSSCCALAGTLKPWALVLPLPLTSRSLSCHHLWTGVTRHVEPSSDPRISLRANTESCSEYVIGPSLSEGTCCSTHRPSPFSYQSLLLFPHGFAGY